MRLAFAGIAVAILVLAIALLSGGGDDNSNNEKPAAQATATATATGTTTPGATGTPTPPRKQAVDPGPLLTGEKVVKIEVDKGDTVRFRARSPQDDEVHVHGYDLKKDLPANQTVTMSFKATIDGIFEIEFEEQGKQIASLRVNP